MKRVLSLVLALSLVLGSIPAGFAADTQTAGEILKGYGVLSGDANGNLNETQSIDRATMYTVLIKLLGKDAEAKAYTVPSTFSDDNTSWAANYIAFAEKEGLTKGIGNGKFAPEGKVTLQQMATIMLRALGYEADYNTAIADATAKGLLAGVVESDNNGMVVKSDVYTSMLNTLKAPVKDSTEALGTVLKIPNFVVDNGVLSVTGVTANTAKSFEVKFSKAVDTTKVAFEVKRDATKATVTTTWNEAKTVATLTAGSKFAEGKYTVLVNDTTDAAKPVEMKKAEVTIEKEKVTKVELTSDVIYRSGDTTGTIGYTVYNQYNENITDSALSRSLQIRTSTDQAQPVTPNYKTGVIDITHGAGLAVGSLNILREMKTVVITITEPTTGFVFTKNVTVSDSINAISEVKINGVVNEKGEKVDFIYGATKAYYLDVTVLDAQGKEVKAKSILNSNGPGTNLTAVPPVTVKILRMIASNGLTVDLVDHPTRSGEGAFRINWGTSAAPTFDTPVTFTVMAPFATSGKNNSTLTTTLKRAAKVETFKMFAPATTVSVGRTVEIPFEAYDQNGNAVTAYSELAGASQVTISGAPGQIQFIRQSDGSAKLFATFNAVQLYYLSSSVANSLTGSYSQIAIDVKKVSATTKIEALRHAKLYTSGAAWGTLTLTDITIRDQYDNKIDMRTDNQALAYYVKVRSSNPAVVSVNNGAEAVMMGDQGITFRGGNTVGVATITYELYKTGTAAYLDSASTLAYNIEKKDVVKVEVKPEDKKVLMVQTDAVIGATVGNDSGIVTDSETFHNALTVHGLTSAGDQVRLASADMTYSSSNSNFTPVAGANRFVYTGVLPTDRTSDATVISAYYAGVNGILSATANVEAVKEKPVADNVYISYDREARRTGVMNVVNNVVEMTATDFTARFNTKSVLWYTTAGVMPAAYAPVKFGAESKFGEHYLNEVRVQKITGAGTSVPTVNANTGIVTVPAGLVAGDEFVFTGITSNGKVADFRIKITSGSTATTDVITALQTMADTNNANSLTIKSLVSAGVVGTIDANLEAYKVAVAAANPSDVDSIAKVNALIATVNANSGAIVVNSVAAVNGTVTLTLAAPTTTATLADFTVTRAINGGVATAVTPTAIALNGTIVTLTVPAVATAAAAQSVVYTVNTVVAPAYTVAAAVNPTNQIAATFASNMFGSYVTFTMPAGQTTITSATKNGVALSTANFDYGVNAGVATVNVSAITDVVKVTIAGTEYTLVIQ